MSTTIQLKRGAAADWVTANPVLAAGEIGIETDTWFYKIGDGSTAWNSLAYKSITQPGEATIINFENQTSTPTAPATDTLNIYARKLGGRMMLRQQGPNGIVTPLQPSFFQNNIFMINTNVTTTVTSIGNSVTSVGTISHPTPTETYGYMTNFVSAATGAATAGTGSNGTLWLRGSLSGANGFFFNARIALPDSSYNNTGASTGSRIFVGLTNQTMAASVASDNPSGHFVGLMRRHVNGGATDTNWQFVTKDNTTLNVNDTGLVFLPQKVYDIFIFCPPQGTTISYRIDNVSDGDSAEGETSNNLPDAATYMRAGFQLQTVNAVARNIRMQRVYVESDR